MRKNIIILILATTGLISCKQGSKSTPNTVDIETLDSTKNVKSQKPSAKHNENNFYTKYEYTESNGARLIIQNSFPKSGINYTDPNGKKYIYAVFWTRITNKTNNPIELTIDFPLDSFEIPSSSGNYMKLLLPSDTLTIDKEPLNDYGLTIKSFLDNHRHKSSLLKRTINAKGSSAFYVVTLSNRGVGGTLRTGFSLKGQNLFYRVNDKEILCGKIDLTKLMLRK
ncbi:hypothetical protein ACM55M_01330 [Flavobacterium sp. ZT3R25]|uniref:hypothetical protein n=1 Tax=Flavobacterium galactosi TaxID=3398735 RepID=UPI003A8373C9